MFTDIIIHVLLLLFLFMGFFACEFIYPEKGNIRKKERVMNCLSASLVLVFFLYSYFYLELFLWEWGFLWIYLFSFNIPVLFLYGFDKVYAINDDFRVPEYDLHLLGSLGLLIGATIGQRLFRHKISKKKFQKKSKQYFYSFIIVLLVGLYFFSGESSDKMREIIKNNNDAISEYSNRINNLNPTIASLRVKLEREVKNQGLIRSIINDTESVNLLEDKLEELIDNRDDLIKKKESLIADNNEMKSKLENDTSESKLKTNNVSTTVVKNASPST